MKVVELVVAGCMLGLTLASSPMAAQNPTPLPDPERAAEGMVFALRGAGVGTQSFLGVAVAEVNGARAKELKLGEERGVEITRIEEDGAAAKAGLKVSDVVLDYNGQRVEGIEQFIRLVRETPVGREVKLLVSRSGATQTIAATMGGRRTPQMVIGRSEAWPVMPETPVMPEIPRVFTTWNNSVLGIEAEGLNSQLAEFFGVREGVLVRSVVKGSAAEKSGIRAGDVVTKIDQEAVTSPNQLTRAFRAARAKKSFIVSLVRNKQETSVTVNVEDSEHEAPKARVGAIKM